MLKSWCEQHMGICVGASFGGLLGVVYLLFGFWNMLVFSLIVTLGAIIGNVVDRKENIALFRNIWQNRKDRNSKQ